MRRNVWMTLGTGVLVTALSVGAHAQVIGRGLERLDLTDEQKAQLTELQEQHREAVIEARNELTKARSDLAALMAASDRDIAAIERALKNVSDLEVAGQVRTLRNREEMRSLLTEEQRAQLDRGRRALAGAALRGRMTGRSARGWNRRTPGVGGRGWSQGRTGVRRGMMPQGRGRLAPRTNVRRGRMIPPQAGFGQGRGLVPGAGSAMGGRFGMRPFAGQGAAGMRLRQRVQDPTTHTPPPAGSDVPPPAA
jgi:Spy/CpxP family protein refolding chaperone